MKFKTSIGAQGCSSFQLIRVDSPSDLGKQKLAIDVKF